MKHLFVCMFMMLWASFAAHAGTITLLATSDCLDNDCARLGGIIMNDIMFNHRPITFTVVGVSDLSKDDVRKKIYPACDNLQIPVVLIDDTCLQVSDINTADDIIAVLDADAKKTAQKPVAVNEAAPLFDAIDFYKAYSDNKFGFNSKYHNKPVYVRGIIKYINTDGNVDLESGSTFVSINCRVKNKDRVVNLAKGQEITVYGKYIQESNMFGLELVDCAIQ